MIPLSRWLANREALSAVTFSNDESTGPAEIAEGCVLPSPTDLAFERGYSEGLAEAEARLNALREEDCQAAARREEELSAMWALRCGETLSSGIATAFAQLQSSIEHQLHDVLLPFVTDAVRRSAANELLQLTKREVSRMTEPPLEIRAPAAVLNRLRDEFGRLGIAAVLIEDGIVELKTKGLSTIFESMAGQWIETLRESIGHD